MTDKRYKLTRDQYIEILSLEGKISAYKLADKYPISVQAIYNIWKKGNIKEIYREKRNPLEDLTYLTQKLAQINRNRALPNEDMDKIMMLLNYWVRINGK